MPSGTYVDITQSTGNITNNLGSNGVDGFCDTINYIGMALSDTYYPSVWLATEATAEGDLVVLGTDGLQRDSLIAPAVLAVLVLCIVAGLAFGVALAVGYLIWGQDSYSYYDPDNGDYRTTNSWTNYISTLNAKYWYVCEKDGYAVGPRSQYASPSDVPEDQVSLWFDHCERAADLSPQSNPVADVVTWLIIGAAAIGGLYLAIKFVPGMLSKPTSQGYTHGGGI